jgi:hypothetical protein
MRAKLSLVDRFFKVLVEEIREDAPEYLSTPFTVAEIYQSLVPYRTHRDRIGAEMNGDYEDALLRLLAGEGGYLVLESETARERILLELRSSNPNTGLYREYAAVGVRLNREAVDEGEGAEEDSGDPDDDLDLDDLLGQAFPEPDPVEEDEAEVVADAGAEDAGAEPTAIAEGSGNGAGGGGNGAGGRPAQAGPTLAEVEPEARPEACPDCRGELPERDALRFCPFCGTNVFVTPCGSCGEVLERSWRFCISCGASAD